MNREREKAGMFLPARFLVPAALLLALSTLGSSRAALSYYSENYQARMELYHLGTALIENGEEVSFCTYDEETGEWEGKSPGKLLEGLEEEGSLIPGKEYQEELRVKNTGSVDAYVRVILYRSFRDGLGEKAPGVDPGLMRIGFAGNGWEADEETATRERMILYYREPLKPGETTEPLTKSISLNGDILRLGLGEESLEAELRAEADAVQARQGEKAVRSAWGVEVEISPGGTLSL